MSTRCQIGFYETASQPQGQPSALIYRHNDGYPAGEHGVMEVLVPWARAFEKVRGLSDAEYASARALFALMSATTGLEETTGYGISEDFHGDLSFYYRVDPNAISVYRCGPDGKKLFSVPIHEPSMKAQLRDARGRFAPRSVGRK